MTTYTLLLFPDTTYVDAGAPVIVINGYETEDDADDAGTAAIADAYFDRALVIPGPAVVEGIANIFQPQPGGGGAGSAGGATP